MFVLSDIAHLVTNDLEGLGLRMLKSFGKSDAKIQKKG